MCLNKELNVKFYPIATVENTDFIQENSTNTFTHSLSRIFFAIKTYIQGKRYMWNHSTT